MPWVLRGIRNGQLTTRWPKEHDRYFDDFHGSVHIRPDSRATIDDDKLRAVADDCPTEAISTEPGPRIDTGRCILCGRCVNAMPDVFRWTAGANTAALSKEALVVPPVDETDDALSALRQALAARAKLFGRSVHVRHVDAGSSGAEEWEIQALTNPVYDLHRLGIFFTASPRHADILLVTGIGTAGMIDALLETREAMPNPVIVIAAGTDAVSGGMVGNGYTAGVGIDRLIDVDVFIPGSPPSPFALLHGILLALHRIPRRSGPEFL